MISKKAGIVLRHFSYFVSAISILLCAALCGAQQNSTIDRKESDEAIASYKRFLLNQEDAYWAIESTPSMGRVYKFTSLYSFLDLNNDNIPELLTYNGSNGYTIFTYISGKVVRWGNFSDTAQLCNGNIVLDEHTYADGGVLYSWYKLNENGEIVDYFSLYEGDDFYYLNGNPSDESAYEEAMGEFKATKDNHKPIDIEWSTYDEFIVKNYNEYIPIDLTEEKNFSTFDDQGKSMFPIHLLESYSGLQGPWIAGSPYLSTVLQKVSEVPTNLCDGYSTWVRNEEKQRNGAAIGYTDEEHKVTFYIPISAFQNNESMCLMGDERIWGISTSFQNIFGSLTDLSIWGEGTDCTSEYDESGNYIIYFPKANFTMVMSNVKDCENLSLATVTLWYTPPR